MNWLLVFLGVFAADVAWVIYARSAARGEVLKTGFAAVAITLLSALVVLEYTHDHAMLLPACLGAFFGTVLPLLWEKRHAAKP